MNNAALLYDQSPLAIIKQEQQLQEKNLKEKDNNLIMMGLSTPKKSQGRKPFVFYPNDTWKIMGWDLLISFILLITCVQTPFDLAFS